MSTFLTTALSTIPASREVSTRSKDTWSIDFSNALHEGEVLASCNAVLLGDMSGFNAQEVPEFVTHAEVIDTSVFVTWDGSALREGITYILLTTGILDTEAAITLLTKIKCLA